MAAGSEDRELDLLLLAAETSRQIPSLDLHARRAHEVENLLEQFLYQQWKAGSRYVRIIHGKGNGKLAEVTRKCLADYPLVETFKNSLVQGQDGAVIFAVIAEKK